MRTKDEIQYDILNAQAARQTITDRKRFELDDFKTILDAKYKDEETAAANKEWALKKELSDFKATTTVSKFEGQIVHSTERRAANSWSSRYETFKIRGIVKVMRTNSDIWGLNSRARWRQPAIGDVGILRINAKGEELKTFIGMHNPDELPQDWTLEEGQDA